MDEEKIKKLTADLLDATHHTTGENAGQFVRFASSHVTLDGYFSKDQIQKILAIMEAIEKE
jgi:hypothetical protein